MRPVDFHRGRKWNKSISFGHFEPRAISQMLRSPFTSLLEKWSSKRVLIAQNKADLNGKRCIFARILCYFMEIIIEIVTSLK
jgi:hypothetical protein